MASFKRSIQRRLGFGTATLDAQRALDNLSCGGGVVVYESRLRGDANQPAMLEYLLCPRLGAGAFLPAFEKWEGGSLLFVLGAVAGRVGNAGMVLFDFFDFFLDFCSG